MEDPEFPDSIEKRIAEHEVFIVFNSDLDAAAFRDWWDGVGRRHLELWMRSDDASRRAMIEVANL